MKILIDTDVILDVALKRESFFADSSQVLAWAESKPGRAAVALHSLANIFYLVKPDARPFIRDLLEFMEVPSVSTTEAKSALHFPMKDFEDALQATAAVAFGAQWLVTRNLAHYKKSPVPAILPKRFLEKIA